MSVLFGDQFASDTNVSLPSARALEIGDAFARYIPALDDATGYENAALFWAAYVGGVFPLYVAREDPADQGAKKPHRDLGDGNEWSRPMRNAQMLSSLWRQLPRAGIGFAPQPAGILIVDIDPRSGGNESWLKICKKHDVDDSECGRTESPRGDGGRHLWFALPRAASETLPVYSHAPLGPGVDRPWQTPVPPSRRWVPRDPGSKDPSARYEFRSYRWTAGDPRALPVAPDVLLGAGELVRIKRTPSGAPVPNGVSVNGVYTDMPLNLDIIKSLVKEGIPLTVMQNRLFKRMACGLIRRRYSETETCEMIWQCALASEQRGEDPWSPAAIAKIVRSARTYLERDDAVNNARNAEFAAALAARRQGRSA